MHSPGFQWTTWELPRVSLRLHEDGEAGETIARIAGDAVNAWIDRQEGGEREVERAARQALEVYAAPGKP